MAQKSVRGGYKHDFVDAVRDDLICQVCQLPARNPQQTTCCGKVYCMSCINRLQSNSCPNCRKGLTDGNGNKHYFPDKASERRIKELKVKCDNKRNGCKWRKELAQLEEHLSKCGYAYVRCKNNCKKLVLRHNLNIHLQNQCPMRECLCPKCGVKRTYKELTTNHLEVCPERYTTCPNPGCVVLIKRKNVPSHFSTCRKERIRCNYAEIGCAHESCRENMAKHITESTQHHLKLAVNQLRTQKSHTIKMNEFKMHKDTSTYWYSPPFYSHPGGYKVCFCIHANGNGKGEGTHVSVFLHMMRGENDDNLVWPMRGALIFTLLNQLEDKNHMEESVVPHVHDHMNRVTDGERSDGGWGKAKFVSHEELGHRADTNCQYLKDDSLYFRVSVKVHEACKPWLTPTVHH